MNQVGEGKLSGSAINEGLLPPEQHGRNFQKSSQALWINARPGRGFWLQYWYNPLIMEDIAL